MGSSRKSSSKSTQHTNISNQLGFELEDGAQAVGIIGDSNQVTFTDHGTVKEAFSFTKEVVGKGLEVLEDSTKNALFMVNESMKSENTQTVDKLISYVPLVVIVGGFAYAFRGKKK